MWFFKRGALLKQILNRTGRFFTHERSKQEEFQDKILKQWKDKPEVLPLVGVVVFVLSIATYHIYHALTSKGDVRINKCKRDLGPHEEIGPTEKTKLYIVDKSIYRPIRELEDLKNDLKITEKDKCARPCDSNQQPT